MKKFSSLVLSAILVLSVSSSAFAAPKQEDVAKKFAKGKFGLQKELKVKKEKVDEFGYKHVRMLQEVDGIPVYGSDYSVSMDKNGKVYFSTGKLDKAAEKFKKTADFISSEKAIENAKLAVNYDSNNMGAEEDTFSQELYLYNVDGNYVPVYLVSVNFLYPEPGAWKVFVNAYDGQIVDKYNNIQYATVAGTGIGVNGDTKALNLDLVNGTYYLRDYTKAGQGIETYDAKTRTRLPGSLVSGASSHFTDGAAVDGHFYAGVVYDYYYSNFGRNSIDGNGMKIKSTVHYNKNYVNAFWNGSQMVYGDGDGVEANALSGALDIVAHEMTHGVTSYESNLTYQNQSGSLNEALSDIFACLAEDWYETNNLGHAGDWKVGEDVWTPGTAGDGLRNLANPNEYGDPDHMNEYINTTQDYGGVHINATIVGHAGYEIWTRIGTEATGKIFYRAQTTYLTSSSNYASARAACLQAAADLYGSGSVQYNAVAAGFNDIGVY